MEVFDRPIVVFDSGLGGLSVLQALVKALPSERFVYYGDSANAPYGVRPTNQIRRLTLDNVDALDRRFSFKAAVIACNTATSAAIEQLRERYPDRPIIGIEPALKLAAKRHPGGRIVVMATNTTLREEKFALLMQQFKMTCRIDSLPCTELVAFVERGELDSPALESVLRRKLAPYLDGAADAIVLGCTHFPFVRPVLRRLLPQNTELVDGSEGTARHTRRRLEEAGLICSGGTGTVELYNSIDSPEILERAQTLLTTDWRS